MALGGLNNWIASARPPALAAVVPATSDSARPAFPLPTRPSAVAVAFNSVWVVEPSRGLLVRIEPGQGTAPVKIPVGTKPSDVAASSAFLWVTNRGDDTVARIDPATNCVTGRASGKPVRIGGAPSTIAAGEAGVWVVDAMTGRLTRLSPVSE